MVVTGIRNMLAAAALLALWLPRPAGAATLLAQPAGNGIIQIQGIGVENACAFEITVSYDTSLLASPRVTLGPLAASALSAVNTSVPGTIRIVLVSITPVRGSGILATLYFEPTGAAQGALLGMSARLADQHGSPLPAVVQIAGPALATSPPAAQPSDRPVLAEGQTGSGSTASSSAAYVFVPAAMRDSPRPAGTDVQTLPPRQEVRSPAPAGKTAARQPAPDKEPGRAPDRESSFYCPRSVLDRLREFTGKRTPEALTALFRDENNVGWKQEPPLLFSDGRAVATVTFLSAPGRQGDPDIAVMGARLLSLVRDTENSNTWIARLLPEQGEWRASVAVGSGGRMTVYPLTIAPVVDVGKKCARKADGAAASRGNPCPADLNNDGRIDSIDEYIYFANILRAREALPAVGRDSLAETVLHAADRPRTDRASDRAESDLPPAGTERSR